MEEQPQKSGSRIWIYLIPVYILVAIPLVRWTMKVASGDLNLKKEDYSAFNSDEGELPKKAAAAIPVPTLEDGTMGVRYRTAEEEEAAYEEELQRRKEEAAERKAAPQKAAAQPRPAPAAGQRPAPQAAQGQMTEQQAMKARQQMWIGSSKGYLTSTVGRLMDNPKAVGAVFNNSWVVNGFMARDTVKGALASPQALQNYVANSPTVGNFLNNPVVQKAMSNPALMSTLASSAMAQEFMKHPTIQAVLNDPAQLQQLTSNPQVSQLLMNPNVLSALSSNPQAASALANIQR